MGLKLGNYSHSMVLGSVWLESPGNAIMIPLNWKLRLQPGHLGLFMPLNPQTKKVITLPTGAIDANYKWQIHLLLHIGNKGVYI